LKYMPTFAYEPGTDIATIRLHIGDLDVSETTDDYATRSDWSCLFSNEELAVFLDQGQNNLFLGSALALRAVCANKVLIDQYQRITIRETTTDMGTMIRDLNHQADQLVEMALMAGASVAIGKVSSNVFDPSIDDQGYLIF
jgi:hypothetical protein